MADTTRLHDTAWLQALFTDTLFTEEGRAFTARDREEFHRTHRHPNCRECRAQGTAPNS